MRITPTDVEQLRENAINLINEKMKKTIVFVLLISLCSCGFIAATFTENKNYEFVETEV